MRINVQEVELILTSVLHIQVMKVSLQNLNISVVKTESNL